MSNASILKQKLPNVRIKANNISNRELANMLRSREQSIGLIRGSSAINGSKRHNKIPDEYAPIIKELYELVPQHQIAAIFNTTQINVSNFMKKHHIKTRRGTPVNYNILASSIKREYLKNARSGKRISLSKVARKFNISRQTVRHHLVAQGVKTSRSDKR